MKNIFLTILIFSFKLYSAAQPDSDLVHFLKDRSVAEQIDFLKYQDYCAKFKEEMEEIDKKIGIPDIKKIIVNYSPLISYEQWKQNNKQLIRAVIGNKIDDVKKLLINGANIEYDFFETKTPLLFACSNCATPMVELLLDNNADVNAKDHNKRDALMIALVARASQELIKLLLSKKIDDINAMDSDNCNALLIACHYNEYNIVKLLLEYGADVNFKNKNGETAFLLTAARFDKIKLFELLLIYGANINEQDCYGKTVLMYAAQSNKKKLVLFLLEQGADINLKDNQNKTALMHAVRNGSTESAQLLLKYGANANETFFDSNVFGNPVCWSYFETMKLLLNYGVDVNTIGHNGLTPLMLASYYGNMKLVKLLLKRGARINFKDEKGRTACMYASQSMHSHIACFLVKMYKEKVKLGHNPLEI